MAILPPGQNYVYTPGIRRDSFTGLCYKDIDITRAKQVGVSALGEHAFLRFQANFFNSFNPAQP